MRKMSIMGFLVGVNFATVGLGQYIDGENGKLAISNISPVLFLMFALPSFLLARRAVPRQLLAFLLCFNALAWLSFMIFTFKYGWPPNFPVLYFQEIEIVFSFLLIWWGRSHFAEFVDAARWGTICSVLISSWYGFQQITVVGALFLLFGMDDKSQAAVLFCCQAFFLVRYFGRPLDLTAAAILLLWSLFSLSRLPILFLPVIFIAVAQRSPFIATASAAAAIGTVVAIFSSGVSVDQVFKIIDRVQSIEAIAADSSNSAHLLLFESGLQIKFMDPYAFFAGIGPGNFARALTSFPISKAELEAVDPILIEKARVNRAPLHSTPLSALLDFSLPVFLVLAYLLAKSFRHLARSGLHVELLFFLTLFTASIFYSIHNKPYVFLLCAAMVVMFDSRKNAINRPDVEGGGHSDGGHPAASGL
jgi:hypothetical protein